MAIIMRHVNSNDDSLNIVFSDDDLRTLGVSIGDEVEMLIQKAGV